MKRLVVLALAIAVVGLPGMAMAECDCCGEVDACNDTYEKGLEFGFSGLCNIGVSTVKYGSIGVKKAMGPNQMGILRFGVGMNRDTQEPGPTLLPGVNPDDYDDYSDQKTGTTMLDVAAGMQMYKPCCGNCLLPYIGGLVKVDYSSNFTEYCLHDNAPDGTDTKKSTTTLGLDLLCFVGGEWFFTKCMSLSGEYTFGFGYERSNTKTESKNDDDLEDKSAGWGFGPFNTAAVRLTMYWQ
jgi:hypothetical protein